MRLSTLAILSASLGITAGFSTSPSFLPKQSSCTSTTSLDALSRQSFLQTSAAIFSTSIISPLVAFADEEITLPSGVKYTITKAGDGPKPDVGELAAIRFKATVAQSGNVIDDIFGTPEPYYTRVGSGGLLKGVEEVIPKMRVGDRITITVPTNLAFGPKGRPASAGKPRIAGDAIILFDVEMVGLPGKEQELIDIIGDE